MADSMTKVGSITHFDAKDPNWAENLSVEYVLSRRLLSFFGGAATLEAIASEIPITTEFNFQCHSKQEEYTLLTFFLNRYGRWRRFWIKHPAAAFTLKTAASSGATGLYCKRNRFDLIQQGYERIYIQMSNGDKVVRKITSCVDSASSTYIGFDTVLDRDITLTNHYVIGRYLLSRFNTDKAKFKFITSSVSQITLSVTELVKEYSLAD